ncbi:MAG TPA: hypothetical protein VFF04_00670, partial [Candidatus Babeliales bacterium]|nr:hypothetical protein [Candidatus Babeliales bacterium]
MKCLYLLPLLLCISLYSEQIRRADPLIVAVLMVKDEAPVIVKTLQPLVEGGIDAYFIFDTGSTDNTRELAQQYLTDHAIT